MLYTVEQVVQDLQRQVNEARRRADAAMDYAESTSRLHHAAICRLNHLVTGSYHWPADSQP